MAIRISGTTGIDMGNTSVSNVDVGVLEHNAVNRQYVDDSKIGFVKLTGDQTIEDVKTFSSNIVGSITGNAATATKLETVRTIALAGGVTGNIDFDGSENVSITTIVADDSHNHIISNVDGLQDALDGKANQSTTYTKAEIDTKLSDVNLTRADKYLANKDVANLIYSAGNLVKIRYTTDHDVDYEVLAYAGEDLTNVAHYVDGVLQGNTVLTYSGGNLVSSIFVGV